MNNIKLYISGSEKNAPSDFTHWRNEVRKLLKIYDCVTLLDPMKYFDYGDNYPITPRQCYNYFLWLINKSDVLLVNLDYTDRSVGTGIEVDKAYNKIPIIGFGKKKDTWYEWDVDKCEVIFNTLEEAIIYIVDKYCLED